MLSFVHLRTHIPHLSKLWLCEKKKDIDACMGSSGPAKLYLQVEGSRSQSHRPRLHSTVDVKGHLGNLESKSVKFACSNAYLNRSSAQARAPLLLQNSIWTPALAKPAQAATEQSINCASLPRLHHYHKFTTIRFWLPRPWTRHVSLPLHGSQRLNRL